MKINLDRVLDYMMEADADLFDYAKSSMDYSKKHGYGVRLDLAKTPEEKHIVYAYHCKERSSNAVWAITEILGLDREQQQRLYIAERAVKRWYEKETKWQRLLPEDLISRLYKFIEG